MVGDHILTQHDLAKPTRFEDAVCIGGWPMDDHPPGGFDRADLPPAVQIKTQEVYGIPLRSLYSKNISNLMMAGRNISASHVAFTSTRVMATCAVEGQAVGTAAALCVKDGLTPRDLTNDKTRLEGLQQTLLRNDQSITGIRNSDPSDLARQTKVKASHEQDDAPARNLLDGEVRDVPKGAKHHWAAKPGSSVELEWDSPHEIRQVQITFDTGFQRELTLTSSDAINRGIVRGAQPETVKDYQLFYRESAGSEWKPLASQKGNYQRLFGTSFSQCVLKPCVSRWILPMATSLHAYSRSGATPRRVVWEGRGSA